MGIRIIRHSIIPDSGSFEVRYPDERKSVYFYWEDNAGRRAITLQSTQEAAKKQAQELARRG